MKAKFYMSLVMFTIIGLALVGGGCGDSGDDPKVEPPVLTSEYEISVSNITVNTADISVIPTNKNQLYFAYTITKSDYEKYMGSNPENLKDYIPALLKEMSEYYTMSIELLLDPLRFGCKGDAQGESALHSRKMIPDTEYVAFAVGVHPLTGQTVDKGIVSEVFKTMPEGVGSEVTITMTAGDENGENIGTKMLINIKSSNIVDGDEFLMTSADMAYYKNLGFTENDLINDWGKKVTATDIENINKSEGATNAWSGCLPLVEYTYMVRLINTGSGITIAKQVEATLDDGTGESKPQIEIIMTTGDADGNDPDTKITITSRTVNGKLADGGKVQFLPSAEVAEALANGETYESLVELKYTISRADVERMNSPEGHVYTEYNLAPETEYTHIIRLYNDAGDTVVHHELATEATPTEEPSAYEAWLGNWTVTSTSSEVGKAPVSFDVEISEYTGEAYEVNTAYHIKGWSITTYRTEEAALMEALINEDGGIEIKSPQYLMPHTQAGYMVVGVLRYLLNGKYYCDFGTELVAMKGLMGEDKTSATVAGVEFTNTKGTHTITGMDYFPYDQMFGRQGPDLNPADGFTKKDYTVGPYTLTKKEEPAPAAKSFAPKVEAPRSVVINKAASTTKSVTMIDQSAQSKSYKQIYLIEK